jgi:hypothetical protein
MLGTPFAQNTFESFRAKDIHVQGVPGLKTRFESRGLSKRALSDGLLFFLANHQGGVLPETAHAALPRSNRKKSSV